MSAPWAAAHSMPAMIAESGQLLAEPGDEPGELGRLQRRQQVHVRGPVGIALQRFDERLVGEGDDLVAAAVQHDRLVAVETALRELPADPRLAGTGLTGDGDQLARRAGRR